MGTTILLAKYEIWVSFLCLIFNIFVAFYSSYFNLLFLNLLYLFFKKKKFEMRNGSFIAEGQLVMLLLS